MKKQRDTIFSLVSIEIIKVKVKVQVYSLISSLKTYHPTLHLTPGHWICSFVCHFNSTESIQSCSRFGALNLSYTLPSLSCSFSPESSEAFEGEVPCPRTHHLYNVPRLRGEKHYISLKILHHVGFETARQTATAAERHALTVAPCPSQR